MAVLYPPLEPLLASEELGEKAEEDEAALAPEGARIGNAHQEQDTRRDGGTTDAGDRPDHHSPPNGPNQ